MQKGPAPTLNLDPTINSGAPAKKSVAPFAFSAGAAGATAAMIQVGEENLDKFLSLPHSNY
jgi:hypothetical protein